MVSDDPIRRKQRWQAFYDEPDGLRDMLATIRATYFQRLSQVEPWQVAQLANLGIAAKITDQLDQMIRAVIDEGKVAEAAKLHTDKIASLPDYKRRWL